MASTLGRVAVPSTARWWNDERWRGILYQVALALGVAALGWFLVANTLSNLQARHIATGFGFLGRDAEFDISESPIPYQPGQTYLRAFAVGLLNTVKVAAAGIVLATILGLVMGVARLSGNWLVARLATIYVETVRNIPLLLQLFLWYALATTALPQARGAYSLFGAVYLSNRGLRLPGPQWDGGWTAVSLALLAGIVAAWLVGRVSRRRQESTGKPLPATTLGLVLVVGLPLVAFLASGASLPISLPALTGFNFTGGLALSPEFAALLFGLVVYTGAFIAEIVRSGISAVARGQTEAANALGLSPGQTLRLVIMPQAMRVITPPLTSQYLNLTKNSTLAVAIGYPDLVNISQTAINQTGQAVEGVTLMMVVYLVVSLALSFTMNAYNRRVALRGGAR